jgi:hypothetical protein
MGWSPFAAAVVALTTFIVIVPSVDVFYQHASPRRRNPGSEMSATIAASFLFAFLAIDLAATRVPGQSSRDGHDADQGRSNQQRRILCCRLGTSSTP